MPQADIVFAVLCGIAGVAGLALVKERRALGAFMLGLTLAWFAAVWLSMLFRN